MSAQFREAKSGYLKSEVDTYILRLEHDIEEYQFEEKQKEQSLAEAKKLAEEILTRANKKSADILAQAEDEAALMNKSVSIAVQKIISVQNSFEHLTRSLLIKEIDESDARPALNDIKTLDYEISRKIIFIESVAANPGAVGEYAPSLNSASAYDRERDRESRLLLQKKAADKTNYAVVIPLLIILFISVYIILKACLIIP